MRLQSVQGMEFVLRPRDLAQLAEICGSGLRVALLLRLIRGEQDVTTIVEAIGTHQSSVSRELQFMLLIGLVALRRDGWQHFYSLGPAVTLTRSIALVAIEVRAATGATLRLSEPLTGL